MAGFLTLPTSVYSHIYKCSGVKDLLELALLSREQSQCIRTYIRGKELCMLCEDGWVSTEDIRHDTIFINHPVNFEAEEIELKERCRKMHPAVRSHLLCDACESITWTRTVIVPGQWMKNTEMYPYFELVSQSDIVLDQRDELLRLFYHIQRKYPTHFKLQLCLGWYPWVVLFRYKRGVTYWNAMRFVIGHDEVFLHLYDIWDQ